LLGIDKLTSCNFLYTLSFLYGAIRFLLSDDEVSILVVCFTNIHFAEQRDYYSYLSIVEKMIDSFRLV